MTQAVQNPMAGWEPQLHPRDSHGRFRNTWSIPEVAKKLIQGILKGWNSPKFKSDDHAQAYADQLAHVKKRSPEQMASIDYFMTEAGNEDIQSTLRVGKDDLPQVRHIDSAMAPLPHDLILTRVLGPDAFGLPPERMGEVEEWTGKLLFDHGYAPTNLGTPHQVPGPHITMSILAPHGTRAVVPGDGRSVILDREQPLRITKVEPDGHGGLFVYAVVAPKQGNKQPARALGKELAPGEVSPAIEATPEELKKRGLDENGNPIPKGAQPLAPQPAAPPGKSIPPENPIITPQPPSPEGGSNKKLHEAKAAQLQAKIDADKAAGKEPTKEDLKNLEQEKKLAEVSPAAPEPTPIEGPASKPGFKDKNLEPGPPHPDQVAKKEAAKAAQQETAKAEAPAEAAATVDELINKKASNKTIAEHLRSIAAGNKLQSVDDEGDRQAITDDLESAAKAFEDDQPLEGKKIIRALARATGVETQGKAGEKTKYDPSVHDAVNPDGLNAGDEIEVIRPGATMKRKDGTTVHLDRAVVRRAGTGEGQGPKVPEKKTGFGAPKISKEERLTALKTAKKTKIQEGPAVSEEMAKEQAAAKKAAKAATPAVKKTAPKKAAAPKKFHEDDLSKNTVAQLREHAKDKGIKVPSGARKADIVKLIQGDNGNKTDVGLPEMVAPGKPLPKKTAPAKKAVPAPKPKPELTESQKLNKKLVKDLRADAEAKGIKIPPGARKADIIKYLTGEAKPPEAKPKPKPIPTWIHLMSDQDLRDLAKEYEIPKAGSMTNLEVKQALVEAKATKPKAPPKPKAKTLAELKKEAKDRGLSTYGYNNKGQLQSLIDAHDAKIEKAKPILDALPQKIKDLVEKHGDDKAKLEKAVSEELLYSGVSQLIGKKELQDIADAAGVGNEWKTIADSSYGGSGTKHEMVSLLGAKARADRENIPLGIAMGDLRGFTRVGPQGGSNPGGVFEAPDGSRWYVKAQKSSYHSINERNASLLYRLAGVDVPEVYAAERGPKELAGNGNTFTASRIVPGAKSDLHARVSGHDEEYLAKIYDGFAIDAWLGNWDVAGSGWDNIVTDEAGNPVRIDAGGAMEFRAQGGSKGLGWGPIATEWDSFQDPDSQRPLVLMYRGMTPEQRTRAVQALERVTPERLQEMRNRGEINSTTLQKLLQRREDILSRERNGHETPFYAGAKIGDDVLPSAAVGTQNMSARLAGSGLSEAEIQQGFHALNTYQGSGYNGMALHLRGDRSLPKYQSASYQSDIDAIDRVMSHAELTEDVVVYRGERNPSRSFPEGVWSMTGGMEGMEWTFPTYSSTSASEEAAREFAKGGTNNENGKAQPTVFRIRVPKGHHAMALDEGYMKETEHELLLPHHLRYRVVKDHGVDSTGVRRLDVEALETSGDKQTEK